MTCQELHCYLENPLRVEVYMYRESLPRSVSSHLVECRDCACLFEEQKALGISLNMARDAAPQVPPGLEAKVLANYWRQMEEPESFVPQSPWRFSNAWLPWGVATVIALVAVFSAALFLGRSRAPIRAKKIAQVGTQNAPLLQQQASEKSAKQSVAAATFKQKTPVKQVPTTNGVNISPLPPGFASLMYCDELTCSGAMEVIRVELPPAAGQAAAPAASPVMAEVLVGDDGVARGIRIVP